MSNRWLSVLCFLLVLQAAAVTLAFLAAGEIPLNTDSSAPISQLELLRDGSVASLAELRLARIPSFVPDLLVLRGLISLDGVGRGGLGIQAQFALVMALLLLGLQTQIVSLATGLGRWLSLAAVLVATAALLLFSPTYREATGLALSPVHHGGNVIMTLLAAVLLAGLCGARSPREARPWWLLLLLLVSLGAASNLLFLATAVAPLALCLASRPAAAALGVSRALRLGSLAGATVAGLVASRGFNLQCVVEAGAVFGPARLLEVSREAPLVPLAGLLAVSVLLKGWRGCSSGMATWMVALAALSPFVVTPLFAEIETRYLLMPILLVPVLIPVLLLSLQGRGRHLNVPPPAPRQKETAACLAAVVLLAISLAGPPADCLASQLSAREDSARLGLVEQLVSAGHRHGLGGFWDAHLGAASVGRLEVQPINGNGEPDLWAHNREAFLQPRGRHDPRSPRVHGRPVKPYSFVIVDGKGKGPTWQEVVEAYGRPSGTLGCRGKEGDGNGFCALLYVDPLPLQQSLANKLRNFDNRCSRRGNLR